MGERELPEGVLVLPLKTHADPRGTLTEIFRASWTSVRPVQWNFVASRPGTVRGVHVHRSHWDYWLLLSGRATVGLSDLRGGKPGPAATLPLSGGEPRALVIPPGVAHGFMFHEASTHAYAVDEYWNPDDEEGCRWDDPALGIDWPAAGAPVLLSDRDRDALPLARLLLRVPLRPSRPSPGR